MVVRGKYHQLCQRYFELTTFLQLSAPTPNVTNTLTSIPTLDSETMCFLHLTSQVRVSPHPLFSHSFLRWRTATFYLKACSNCPRKHFLNISTLIAVTRSVTSASGVLGSININYPSPSCLESIPKFSSCSPIYIFLHHCNHHASVVATSIPTVFLESFDYRFSLW